MILNKPNNNSNKKERSILDFPFGVNSKIVSSLYFQMNQGSEVCIQIIYILKESTCT